MNKKILIKITISAVAVVTLGFLAFKNSAKIKNFTTLVSNKSKSVISSVKFGSSNVSQEGIEAIKNDEDLLLLNNNNEEVDNDVKALTSEDKSQSEGMSTENSLAADPLVTEGQVDIDIAEGSQSEASASIVKTEEDMTDLIVSGKNIEDQGAPKESEKLNARSNGIFNKKNVGKAMTAKDCNMICLSKSLIILNSLNQQFEQGVSIEFTLSGMSEDIEQCLPLSFKFLNSTSFKHFSDREKVFNLLQSVQHQSANLLLSGPENANKDSKKNNFVGKISKNCKVKHNEFTEVMTRLFVFGDYDAMLNKLNTVKSSDLIVKLKKNIAMLKRDKEFLSYISQEVKAQKIKCSL